MFISTRSRLAVPIAFIMLTLPAGTQQQKVPAVTKCRADHKLYIFKFKEATRQWLSGDKTSEWPLPNADDLTSWSEEMKSCKKVDPDKKCDYDFTVGEINAERFIRLELFLHKHNLLEQFRQEDAKGELRLR